MIPGTRILIVEDEQLLAVNVRDYLSKRYAVVRISSSGEEAIDCVLEFKPDIVLSDYALPGISGLETFERLKAMRWHCRCVLITGNPTEALREAAMAAGVRHVIEKPFALAALDVTLAAQPSAAHRIAATHHRNSTRRLAERRRNVDPAGLAMQERRHGERRRDVDCRRRKIGAAEA